MPGLQKASRRGYTQDVLEEAVAAVRNGMTVTAAAKQYAIPRQTLKDKVSGRCAVQCRMGRPSILNPDEEKVLVDWVISIGAAGFPITKDQLLNSVQKLMINLKRDNPFSENAPGEKWLSLFLHRHPDISGRIAQALTTSRANVTEAHIRKWFEEVKTYVAEKNLQTVFETPSRIFNCDETAFFLCPKGKKVFVRRGEKHVYTITGNDEKECLTALIMANAAGDLAPPMIVYSYARVPYSVVQQMPNAWGVGKSDNGWMTGETFFEYISNVFYPWLQEQNILRPVILFVDGHTSHLTLHLSEFCSNHGIELISLYPNSTHILQPMDVAVFHPVKSCWRKTVDKWRSENGSAKIKKEDFAPMLKTVLDTSVKPSTVRNGFITTGLSTLDPDKLDFTKLVKSQKRYEVDKSYSHSQWLLLHGHLTYVESKINNEMLARFKAEGFHPEEEALYHLWRSIKNDVLQYRESLDNQEKKKEGCAAAEAPKSNQFLTTTPEPQKVIVIASALPNTDEVVVHDSITDDLWGDLAFDTRIEIDVPMDDLPLSNISPPSLERLLPSCPASSQSPPITSLPSNNIENPTTLSTHPSLLETTTTVPDDFSTPTKTTPEAHCSKFNPSTSKTNLTPEELKENVSTPFKKALFWPGESQSKKKKLKKKLPSAITSDEWKNYYKKINEEKSRNLEEKQKRKELREIKAKLKIEESEKKRKIKRRKPETDDDEQSDDMEVYELDDPTQEPLELNIEHIRPSQWIVVPYENKKYVGQIMSIDSTKQTAIVKYLSKKLESEHYFWPRKDDVDSIEYKEILQILREPTFDRWGYLKFSDFI